MQLYFLQQTVYEVSSMFSGVYGDWHAQNGAGTHVFDYASFCLVAMHQDFQFYLLLDRIQPNSNSAI